MQCLVQERKGAACWQWRKGVTTTLRRTGRGASRNFLCKLCIPEVLKVLITAGFALPVTLLSKPRAPCPAYFLSSGVAYLGRKNRITSASPLANEKSIDKYALWTILYCPGVGRDIIGEKVPMELKIWIRDEWGTYKIHGLKKHNGPRGYWGRHGKQSQRLDLGLKSLCPLVSLYVKYR